LKILSPGMGLSLLCVMRVVEDVLVLITFSSSTAVPEYSEMVHLVSTV
jgi:hypothetical protein